MLLAMKTRNNNNNISKAPFPNGPKALFTRLKIQVYNETLKKLKEVKSKKIIKINNYNKVINLKSTLKKNCFQLSFKNV